MNNIPWLNHQQYRAVRRLVHDYCNYDNGNCIALNDSREPCVCIQRINHAIVCK